MIVKPFCVYSHHKNGKIYYIGKGSLNRAFDHKSRNEKWKFQNEINGPFETKVWKLFVLSKDAIDYEAYLIKKHKPLCNIKHNLKPKKQPTLKKIKASKPISKIKSLEPISKITTMPILKKEPTKVEGIRLPPHLWPMFRDVLRHKGREWLEKLIAREHKKLP